MDFKSAQHRKNFRRVLAGLKDLGYGDDLLYEDYSFSDFFAPGQPTRVLPAAVFGRTPPSFDTACISILVSGRNTPKELVNAHRAFGAPVAFEVDESVVRQWKVSAEPSASKVWKEFPATAIKSEFNRNADNWSPDSILRAKNITAGLQSRQLDFVDLGLLPALEEQVRQKLDALLRDVLSTASATHKKQTKRKANDQELFRLVFRLLAAKVLCDRQVNGFRSIRSFDDVDDVLSRVGRYYKQPEPIIDDPETRSSVADRLWNSISFQNLSVESLAYVYEHTLIDDKTRKKLGIHSTPVSVARFIAGHMLTNADINQPLRIVEPCSGHGIFLVAALERLRDLLPSDVNPDERHGYFVESLYGFEKDAFALEISQLCLMLADFPFPNGWNLKPADVFDSKPFGNAVARADIVLCNPPFEPFNPKERATYSDLTSTQKPVELLTRVLDRLKPTGTLGFVLPWQVLDGKGYKLIREQLARRFADIEVVALPDRVFNVSQLETAIVLAKSPQRKVSGVSVSYSCVRDGDRDRFLDDYAVSWRESEQMSSDSAIDSLKVSPLREIWEFFRAQDQPTIGDIATLHRGVEWQSPFVEEKYISRTENRGFRKGFHKVDSAQMSFHPPKSCYLSFRKKDRRGKAFDYPWEEGKVFVNAVRVSRGPWRMAAFVDAEGHCASQNFFGVWSESVPLEVVAAILNHPIANAFVWTHDNARHNRKKTLNQIPIPRLSPSACESICKTAHDYSAIFHTRKVALSREVDRSKAMQLPPAYRRDSTSWVRATS